MKNKLAKLLALLLAAALLTACMAGCTGKTEQPAKAEATEEGRAGKGQHHGGRRNHSDLLAHLRRRGRSPV